MICKNNGVEVDSLRLVIQQQILRAETKNVMKTAYSHWKIASDVVKEWKHDPMSDNADFFALTGTIHVKPIIRMLTDH